MSKEVIKYERHTASELTNSISNHDYLKRFELRFSDMYGSLIVHELIYNDKVSVTIAIPYKDKDFIDVCFNEYKNGEKYRDYSYEITGGTIEEGLTFIETELKKLSGEGTVSTISVCDEETGEIEELELIDTIQRVYDEQFDVWVNDKFPKVEVDNMIIEAVKCGYKHLLIDTKEIMEGHKNAFVTSKRFYNYLKNTYPDLIVEKIKKESISISWCDLVDDN